MHLAALTAKWETALPGRPWQWTVAQVASVGVVGGTLFGPGIYVVAIFIFGLGPIVLIPAAIFGVAILYVVALATSRGSLLTESPGGRLAWASAILALGVIGWVAGATAFAALGLAVTGWLWWWLLSAVPFALAAALCAGGWASIVAIALTAALILTGCIAH